jgi:hypothetical protein
MLMMSKFREGREQNWEKGLEKRSTPEIYSDKNTYADGAESK